MLCACVLEHWGCNSGNNNMTWWYFVVCRCGCADVQLLCNLQYFILFTLNLANAQQNNKNNSSTADEGQPAALTPVTLVTHLLVYLLCKCMRKITIARAITIAIVITIGITIASVNNKYTHTHISIDASVCVCACARVWSWKQNIVKSSHLEVDYFRAFTECFRSLGSWATEIFIRNLHYPRGWYWYWLAAHMTHIHVYVYVWILNVTSVSTQF